MVCKIPNVSGLKLNQFGLIPFSPSLHLVKKVSSNLDAFSLHPARKPETGVWSHSLNIIFISIGAIWIQASIPFSYPSKFSISSILPADCAVRSDFSFDSPTSLFCRIALDRTTLRNSVDKSPGILETFAIRSFNSPETLCRCSTRHKMQCIPCFTNRFHRVCVC